MSLLFLLFSCNAALYTARIDGVPTRARPLKQVDMWVTDVVQNPQSGHWTVFLQDQRGGIITSVDYATNPHYEQGMILQYLTNY